MKSWLTVIAIMALTGCNGMNMKQFENAENLLSLPQYFAGRTYAWGIFEDRFGQLRRQFRVTIDGRMEADTLILDEQFVYSDGSTEQRVWRIESTGPQRYKGTADDVIGSAVGEVAGNALHWRYQMNVAVGEGHWRVNFDDWMWLQPGGVLINRATVSKWGITLGTVTLFFSKQEHGQ